MARPHQKTRRIRRRVEVHYGPDQPRFIGYSGNISRAGIMVRALRVFAPGTILHLELKFPDTTFRLRGEVVWAREGPVQFLSSGRIGMGITFIEPSAEFLDTFRQASSR